MSQTPPDQRSKRTDFTPQERQLARSNLAKAKSLLGQAAETFLDLGQVLNTLAANDLYASLGTYLSFRDFLRKEGLIPYATARKYMVLATQYKSLNARKLGVDKLTALLRLATWEGASADRLVDDDAVIDDKPVSEHTASSLEEANERRRQKQEERKHELESDPALQEQHKTARRTAAKLERTLEAGFAGPDAEARAVRIEGVKQLRVRIELSLEDAQELLTLLEDHDD